MSRDAIGKYESDDIIPTADKPKKMADVLCVSLYFLMNDDAKEDAVDKDMFQHMQEVQKLPDSENDKSLLLLMPLLEIKEQKRLWYGIQQQHFLSIVGLASFYFPAQIH